MALTVVVVQMRRAPPPCDFDQVGPQHEHLGWLLAWVHVQFAVVEAAKQPGRHAEIEPKQTARLY